MDSKSKISVSGAPMNPTGSPAAPMKPLGSSAAPTKPTGSSAAPNKPLGSSAAPMIPLDSSAVLKKPLGSSTAPVKSSGVTIQPIGQSGVYSDKGVSIDSCSKKRNGKDIVGSDVPSAKTDDVLVFKHATLGPQEAVLRFRLIHFWEAWNTFSKILLGLEMLLIDEEGTVIQGFIPRGRIDTYLRHMIPGCTYTLNNFFGSKTKPVYRVADPDVTITFSWNSVLSVLKDSSICFAEDRFRFHGYEEFEAACDKKGDLYDYIGHIKLVNEQVVNESLVLDEVEIASARHILIHVQTHDGPVMRLYIWDKAATAFCEKFKALGNPPTVILVTTVNPKRFGGALSLSSVSASRVFFDMDVQPTREYLAWYETNTDVANRVNAEVVAKAETATIGDLFSYMKQEGAKVAWFECKATIDDVIRDSAWYYIACGGCKTKATKRHTTLMCKKCGKTEIDGSPEYLAKITVYDNKDQAIFVLLGDAGRELTGKPAAELVENYFEANESVGGDHVVPVPQALVGTIGQTRTFVIKVSKHNLDGKTQTLTVTKVLPLGDPAPENVLDDNVVAPPADDALQMGNREEGASSVNEEPGDERVKRSSDMNVSDETKRARRG